MRYGSLYEEMNIKSKAFLAYNFVFLVRRVFVTLNAIFLYDYQNFQVFLTILQSLFVLILMINYKIFEDKVIRVLEIFNELTLLILSYSLLMFSDVC